MPRRRRAGRKEGYKKYEENKLCPWFIDLDGHHMPCQREACALYVERAGQCAFTLQSYYMFLLAREGMEAGDENAEGT